MWVMCIILVGLVGCQTTKAQSVKREGKTFIVESSGGIVSSKDIVTSYTWKDKKGDEYPIYLHKYTKGEKMGQWGVYIIRKSEKTGNEYKYYIPNNVEIASEITKEMKL